MKRNILISALAAILLLAVGFGVYTAIAGGGVRTALAAVTSQGNGTNWNGPSQGNGNGGGGQGRMGGQGRGQGQGGGQGQGRGQANGSGVPNPQNGFTGYTTYQGTVSDYAAPNFTLITADGQKLPVQLGNLNYVANLGLTLKNGDKVTLTGFQDLSGSIAVGTITLDATGQTYTLRSETGRPLWAGGGNK